MSRKLKLLSSRCAACVLAALSCPCGAWADVMEIGHSGVTWVAGGPRHGAVALSMSGYSGAGSAVASSEPEVPFSGPSHSFTPVEEPPAPLEWRETVARIAEKYDLSPTLLEALVWQESRWRPAAVSVAGARGFAQLMPGTARDLGVNPDDPVANLEGGARYLRMQLDTFGGDVEKALAAYNAGPNRVHAAGGIPAIRETRNYVASIMTRLSLPVRR